MSNFFLNYKHHLLIFIFSFLILTKFNIDPDLGWHLSYGREFLETGKISRQDPFSWTMPNFEWGNSYLGYQLMVTYIFNNFGHIVLAFVFGLIGAVAVMFILPSKISLEKTIVITLGVLVPFANLGVRPHMISFLLFAILVFLLEKRFYQKFWHILIWFLLFLTWANFHRGFVVGLGVLAVYLAIDVWGKGKRDFKIPMLVGFFSVIGTIFNPLTVSVWKWAVFYDISSRNNLTSIFEWQPSGAILPANLLLVLSGIVLIWVLVKQKGLSVEKTWTIVTVALFMFAFVVSGFLIFWSIIFIFFVSRSLQFRLNIGGFFNNFLFNSILVLVFSAFLLSFLAILLESRDLNARLKIDGYPTRALEFMREKKLNDRVFNEYSWGGFIDWQYSEIKVFIDGRMASWRNQRGNNILKDYLSIAKGECQKVDEYRVQTALIKKDFNFSCFADWHKVYEDSEALVFQRP